ncbi:DNA cytosine methyltransferase [Empedobacter falsenii]|uniref:DNA cytosine methyltransferase n=1 Tax=Empedobacter falsenii TaxID=343874 RepID=UPI003A809D0C
MIREFHLFAGIGGGILGGNILGHSCAGAVEIDKYCQNVLKQRQLDGWLESFDIYDDIRALNGKDFVNTFDILSGGFPCQAFSYAARGNNIAEKNLWPEMLRFVNESQAPLVFAENVTTVAISTATKDLEDLGYKVKFCKLACMDLGADHKRPRFWLLAVKCENTLKKIFDKLDSIGKLKANFWEMNPNDIIYPAEVPVLAPQKRGVGNAQAPIAAAIAFRILINRYVNNVQSKFSVSEDEIENVFIKPKTWISKMYPNDPIFIHTPTTMGNYHYASMQKHPSCAKYVKVFGKPTALHAEYLMGFPIGYSSPFPLSIENFKVWLKNIF